MKKRTHQNYAVAVAFGRFLVMQRKTQDLSQNKIIKISGIQEISVRRIEHGKQMPSLDTFVVLCKAAGIKPSEMMKKIEESEEYTQVGQSDYFTDEIL